MKRDNKRHIIILILLSLCHGGFSQEIDGAVIFTTNCSACHTIGNGQLVGPDLTGVVEKYDKSWIIRFIRESQVMVAEGDEKAVAVFNAYSMIPMPALPISDVEMDALLDHISVMSKGKTESTVVEMKAIGVPETNAVLKRQLPEDQRTANSNSLLTGFWIAMAGFTVLGTGIWWTSK